MRREQKSLAKRLDRDLKKKESKERYLAGRKRHKERSSRPSVVSPPVEVQELVRKQLARFEAKFGRKPAQGEPLFFDPRQDNPAHLSPDDAETIAEIAQASNAHPELVSVLVRSGIVAGAQGPSAGSGPAHPKAL